MFAEVWTSGETSSSVCGALTPAQSAQLHLCAHARFPARRYHETCVSSLVLAGGGERIPAVRSARPASPSLFSAFYSGIAAHQAPANAARVEEEERGEGAQSWGKPRVGWEEAAGQTCAAEMKG